MTRGAVRCHAWFGEVGLGTDAGKEFRDRRENSESAPVGSSSATLGSRREGCGAPDKPHAEPNERPREEWNDEQAVCATTATGIIYVAADVSGHKHATAEAPNANEENCEATLPRHFWGCCVNVW